MKNYLKNPLLYIIIALSACNSFDQAAFNDGINAEEVAYTVPTTLPESEIEFSAFLHGNGQRKWIAREFKLVDLVEFQDCRLDDTMSLNQDGTYQFDGGNMSCGGDDVPSRSGVYRADYANGQLIFDEGTKDEVIVKVSGLDQGVIALSGKVDVIGVSMTIEGIYTVE